jgi:hypothetical protein
MQNLKLIIGLIIIVVIGILIYRASTITEHYRNISDKVSGYEQFSNSGLVYGNPLIQRDGLNIEISNFGMNSDKMNVILNSDNKGLTALSNGTIKISLMEPKKITAIRTQGLSKFQVLTSMDDNMYSQAAISSSSSSINILTNTTPTEILTLENLIDISTSKLIVARYIKIINANNANATNVKVEFYGIDTSNISDKPTLQSGASLNIQLYNEKAKLITNGIYVSEADNNSPFLLIKMPDNYDHLVNFISFKSNISAFKIKYGHTQNNNVYTIPYNGSFNGNVSENITEYFYFPNPTMLNYITFVPLMTSKKPVPGSPKIFKISEIAVFGTLINPTENKLKYIQNIPVTEKFVNGNVQVQQIEGFAGLTDPYTTSTQLNNHDILNNIQTTQNLCKILEYQDQISNEKIKLERNKQYLLKLQQQTDEIDQLESQIANLQNARDDRIKSTDTLNLVRYQKQKGEEAKVADLIKQRLESQEKLSLNVNFKTDDGASLPTNTPSATPS